ncbi:PepSY-associated TM helix domain-containing protein [uncultured Desulfuromonas sp.]|uniref:PepSY-associated TM helix domain-containing protein n=1 Tax=uncultured Desulfuromonas sp. TaxID=181013 RepID=UPI002AAB8E60|nr:PepSY-associated TM helix domain-containing protein [uncultured Desulfuromonas sp.]
MQKKNWRKIWFLIHSWLAMPLWALTFFVCLSGTIATIDQELVWLSQPQVRANAPSGDAVRLDFDELLTAIQDQQPQAHVSALSRPVKSQYALTATVSYPDATTATLYINPYDGAIQGNSAEFDLHGFIRALHGWLLIPWSSGGSVGWYLVTIVSLPMLGSLISGMILYRRFWRDYLHPRLRLRHGARVLWGDFHRLAGIWSLPFILIIAVSGVWLLIEGVLYDFRISYSTAGPPAIVARADVPPGMGEQPPPTLSPQQAVDAVCRAFPEFKPYRINFPANAYDLYRISGRSRHYPLVMESVSVNPYNGELAQSRRVSDLAWPEVMARSLVSLHMGDFAGLGLKLVYFFFGLLLSLMVYSGMVLWGKRTWHETRRVFEQRGYTPAYLGRRWGMHLSGVVVLLPLLYFAPYMDRIALYRGAAGLGERTIGTLQAGPFILDLAEWQVRPPLPDGQAGLKKTFTLGLRQEDFPHIKAVYLKVGKPRSIRSAGALASGSPYRQFVRVCVPEHAGPDAVLWLTLETWDGAIHRASLPLQQASPITVAFLEQQRG